MMLTLPTYNFIKLVRFKNLSLWDVKRISKIALSSNFPIVKLGEVIQEENVKYKIFDFPKQDFKILGVNNKTGLFDAYIEKGQNINQPYKKVEKGWLAYNPYRINVGSIGIKHDGITYDYISPAYVVFSCKTRLLPEFLFLLFKTNTFSKIIRENTTGSVRQNLSFENLSSFQIPLPSIKEQENLVSLYKSLEIKSNNENDEAIILEKQIDNYLFEQLGIEYNHKIKNKGLNFVRFKFLNKWGVEFNIGGGNLSNLLISKVYPTEPLKKVVEINPANNFNDLTFDEVSFIPMDCISDDYGEITYTNVGSVKKSKGYTKFKEGDLLWAKITPCMENGKSTIASNLLNGYGYGSTEYHVLREKKGGVKIEFVYHLLRTKLIREKATLSFTGSAGQQRVPKSFLDELYIPIPPIEKQLQIIEQIDSYKRQIKNLHASSLANKLNAVECFDKSIFI